MANQRDKSKVGLVFYIDRDIKQKAQAELKKKGITFTQFINFAIYKLIDLNDNEIIDQLKYYDKRTKEGRAKSRAEKK